MSQSIQVSFVQEGDVYTVHTGSSVLKDIVMDYTGVPETERGGNSSTLLIAAALSCFCGSIRAALVARGVPFRATGRREQEPRSPMRTARCALVGIDIDVTVDADEAYATKVDHCAKIVKNCLITASIFEGINVSHSVRRGGSAS